MDMVLRVETYSGYRADERPLRFSFPGRAAVSQYQVEEILDQWYGVGYQCFKVRANDGNVYILRHEQTEDRWRLDSYRRS